MLTLMFGGIFAVKICSLFEYREIIIRAVFLKLQNVAIFQFTYMGEKCFWLRVKQCFWMRVKGLISLSDLQCILGMNLFEKNHIITGICFLPSVNNTKFKIALEEILERNFEYAVT